MELSAGTIAMERALADFCRHFSDMHADAASNPFRFLSEHGVAMRQGPLPSRWSRGIPGACYENAWARARRNERVLYCEGWAMSENLGVPIAHAWCLDVETGLVADSTWDLTASHAYFGVAIPTPVVAEARRTARRMTTEVLFGDWARRDGWRVLSQGAADIIAVTRAHRAAVSAAVR